MVNGDRYVLPSIALILAGCADNPPAGDGVRPPPEPTAARHAYQTTASVGDFLLVTLDKAAGTVSYQNRTNGFAASDVPYELHDGTYTFPADPNLHLVRAIELEGNALIVDVDRAGPARDTRALAVGAITQPIAMSDLGAGTPRDLMLLQFRTSNGGMEVGTVRTNATATDVSIDHKGYWPRGSMMGPELAFTGGDGPQAVPVDAITGNGDYLSISDGGPDPIYVFKTASGFALDMTGGNMIMLEQPATKAFDPAWAGTYRSLAYHKTGAHGTSFGEPEPGTGVVESRDIVIEDDGMLRVFDNGQQLLQTALQPAADAAFVAGPGKLDPTRCNGLFTYRMPNPYGLIDVFVAFVPDGLYFVQFKPGPDDEYDYVYGAALKR